MRKRAVLAATFALALAAGAASAAAPTCTQLFANYDHAVHWFSNSAWGRNVVMPSQVDRAIQRLRQQDCLTSWDDLAFAPQLSERLRGTLRGEHGAAIPPTTLQAGIVLGVTSEVQARQFFASLGYRVRSQGAPFLGRRIYIGPFYTAGGLAEAAEVARRAGFVAPYERFF